MPSNGLVKVTPDHLILLLQSDLCVGSEKVIVLLLTVILRNANLFLSLGHKSLRGFHLRLFNIRFYAGNFRSVLVMKVVADKIAKEAVVENVTENVKKPKLALIGIKEGAAAARQAATKIVSIPSRLFDSALYGASYGVAYGAVFTSLVIAKMLPADSLVVKGLHEGAKVAHKDFKTRQESRLPKDSAVVN
jgi:hypothetical protein